MTKQTLHINMSQKSIHASWRNHIAKLKIFTEMISLLLDYTVKPFKRHQATKILQ